MQHESLLSMKAHTTTHGI